MRKIIYALDGQESGPINNLQPSQVKRIGTNKDLSLSGYATLASLLTKQDIPTVTILKPDGTYKYVNITDVNGVPRRMLYDIPQITIASATLTTLTVDANGYGQNGKSVQVSVATASTITIQTTSEPNFVAVYTKTGVGALTFAAGSGVTLIQFNGTNVVGENGRAALQRIGSTNTFILYA